MSIDAIDDSLGKRRDRSNSMLEDARKEGGASPPSNRAKHAHANVRQGVVPVGQSANQDRPDPCPSAPHLRQNPARTTPGNLPQLVAGASRTQASSASASKTKPSKTGKGSNMSYLTSVQEDDGSGPTGTDGEQHEQSSNRPRIPGAQIVTRKS